MNLNILSLFWVYDVYYNMPNTALLSLIPYDLARLVTFNPLAGISIKDRGKYILGKNNKGGGL